MTKYRIIRTYDGYCVQRKSWFGWSMVADQFSSKFYSYKSYKSAKKGLESFVKADEAERTERLARKNFVTRYFYPPLPEEEPENA
jgi:hypothetical protein